MGLLKSFLELAFEGLSSSDKQKTNETTNETTNEEWQNTPPTCATSIEDFAEILRTNFPIYTVRQYVPVTDLVGFVEDHFLLYPTRPYQTYKAEWGQPYSFVLYMGDSPLGVIMLGHTSSHMRRVKYLISRMYAKKLGIPYINFYDTMPNKREYVIKRIKDMMG